MELRQLLYFVTVADELHFSRAAERLHMTQPPLSMQIRRLEEEMELELFKRTKRSVKMTAAGEMLYRQATAILDKVDRTKELCRLTHRGEVGRLTIGFIPIALELELLGPIKRFRKKCPGVHLTLQEMGTSEQLEAVHRGRAQVGFIQTFDRAPQGLESRRIASETYWLAIPEQHELAGYRRVPLAALEGVNLILPPRRVHAGITGAIVGSCRQAGFEPRVEVAVAGYHAALSLVASGFGVTHVPKAYTKKPVAGVAYRPVSVAWPRMEITMIWRRDDADPVLARFVEAVK
ncbi:MAG: LysR family transcriptional regulator [bacterium]|nr:LysR family transcriptional regulator [bacterium]